MSYDELFLDSIAQFELQHAAREEMLIISRKVIQNSSKAIRSAHRGEYEVAEEIIVESRELLNSCSEKMGVFPVIAANSLFYDAQKEYCESCALLAIVQDREIPSRETLAVEPAAYVNGIVEAASELRRSILDLLRQEDLDRAQRLLEVMDDIYTLAIAVDYPDALTHALRRTTDAFRAVLERTRGDITTAAVFLKARS